ncbi:hypothetical protein [Perspicuibacillus lycopersici]|uniref:hypothetical protein n=1 Tax=Perspicuibacillus lycopersici TaxID=1325689 RepID=UPI0021DA1DD3|nr:hypothetical protein [Perspicuibacillus lycopersici]
MRNKVQLNRQAGSIYLEMLLSLFVWLTILCSLIPAFFHLTISRKALLLENEANHILTTQIAKWYLKEPLDTVIEGEGTIKFFVEIEREMEEIRGICVRYQGWIKKEKRICRTIAEK